MHVILTGATGLVGSACLSQMLSSAAISKISVLSRRPVQMATDKSKVDVIIHNNFEQYDSQLLERLKGAEGCVWALGVSQNDVNKEEYSKITLDYPVAAAKAFATLSDRFKFVYVSGEGATTTPGTFTSLFGRVKGQAEAQLLLLSQTSSPNLRVYSVRPGFVDAQADAEIQPFIPVRKGIIRAAAIGLGPIVRTAYQSMHSPTVGLGKAIVELVSGPGEPLQGKGISGEGRTVANVALRRISGL